MFRPNPKLPVLVLTALLLLVAGCGGDDGPTKAEFIKQAETICIRIDKDESQQQGAYLQENLARIKREPPPPKNTRTVADIIQKIRVPAIMKELEELEALELPEADKEKLQKIFAETKEGAKELNEEPQLLWASRAGNPLYPAFKAAQEYGFSACAES